MDFLVWVWKNQGHTVNWMLSAESIIQNSCPHIAIFGQTLDTEVKAKLRYITPCPHRSVQFLAVFVKTSVQLSDAH